MNAGQKELKANPVQPLDITDEDIYEAKKDIKGYLDITPGDFKVLYSLAYKHARMEKGASMILCFT